MQSSTRKQIERAAGCSNCFDSISQRIMYAYDGSGLSVIPAMVVRATDTAQVSRVLAVCNRTETPVVCRGAGSGLTGGAVPPEGGVVLDMAGMCDIRDIDPVNQTAVVQPGVVTADLQAAAETRGMIYPPDPASVGFCTVGGNAATNAGGLRAVKYGVTRDYVLSLEVVLADGTVMRTGTPTFKCVVGYDLTRLMIGSEGTLGVFTELVLRLLPKPESVSTINAIYDDLNKAQQGVQAILGSGIRPAALEFMSQASIRAVNSHLNLGLPLSTKAMLLIDLDGPPEMVSRQADDICTLISHSGATQVQHADDPARRNQLWSARRAIAPACHQLRPDKMGEDIVVPIGNLGQMLTRIDQISETHGLPVVTFGHAGDGNLHVAVMFDAGNSRECTAAKRVVTEVFDTTLDLGGSLSGEHGVGLTKRPYVEKELDPAAVAVMKQIKHVFDPKGIINPNKKIPE